MNDKYHLILTARFSILSLSHI